MSKPTDTQSQVLRKVNMHIERWPTKQPFTITGHTFTEARVLIVTIQEGSVIGRGEATGIYYLGESAESLLESAQSLIPELEAGLDRQALQQRLPRGGARNAIDCALWDLEIKLSGRNIWQYTGIQPKEIISVNAVGIDEPEQMSALASRLDTPKIKIKLDNEDVIDRVRAIRQARPDAELIIDANQGWNISQLRKYAPALKSYGIAMIEQPLPRGSDSELDNYTSPLPLCADESCLDSDDLEQVVGRYHMVNIKLDKTGGLTEALKVADLANKHGLDLMVGNMLGTSLAMAPAYVIAQHCQLADLDGPVLLKNDREHHMTFCRGVVSEPSSELWG